MVGRPFNISNKMSLAKRLRKFKDDGGVLSFQEVLNGALVSRAAKKLKSEDITAELVKMKNAYATEGVGSAEFWDSLSKMDSLTMLTGERTKGVIHPSSFHSACKRAVFYELSMVPTSDRTASPDAKLQFIFDLGHFIHRYVQTALYSAGVLVGMEVPVVSRKHRINGRGDGIVVYKEGTALLEIKSINDYGFRKLTNRPKDEHDKQAQVYAAILKQEWIVYLYVNKNTCEMKVMEIPFDEALAKKELAAMRTVVEQTIEGVAPDRICEDRLQKAALACAYCSHCFSK